MTEATNRLRNAGSRRFPPYPEYRNSGVKWLGKIPAHWDVRRLKTIASVRLSNVDKHSEKGQVAVKLCNYVDVYYNDLITADLDFMSATAPPEQVRWFLLRVGDVLITKDSESWKDIAVPAVVREDLPDVLCGYYLAHITPGADLDGRFLARQFSAIGTRDQFYVAANGITRFGLGGDGIRTGVFPVAPIEEQRAIADFLDRETAKIDALVARKERLIELLQEKRTALITRAVTRGLDPNVPMKDSGVEWLRRLPSHWTGLPLKRWVATKITDGPHETPEFLDEGVQFISADAVSGGRIDFNRRRGFISERAHKDYSRKCGPVRDDILVCKSGATTGKLAMVEVDFEFSIWSPLALVRADARRVRPRFLALALESRYVQEQIRRTWSAGTQPNISMADLEQLFIAAPSIAEQDQILGWLGLEAGAFGEVEAKVCEAIDYFKEFRTALISAAVTGKIDVREAVPR